MLIFVLSFKNWLLGQLIFVLMALGLHSNHSLLCLHSDSARQTSIRFSTPLPWISHTQFTEDVSTYLQVVLIIKRQKDLIHV